jgi:hypothetical protein
MANLFRVLPYVASARRGQPGHPLYVPRSTGASRVDNPGLYEMLYLGDSAAGAVAEAFGWSPTWNAGLLRGTPSLPGSVRALVEYDLDVAEPVCDLDDANRLLELGLRPSQVVTRDRAVTQAWAASLYGRSEFAGVRWWSYYAPRWGSFGLWRVGAVSVRNVEVMTSVDQPDFVAAAEVLCRPRVAVARRR